LEELKLEQPGMEVVEL
jgi:hypothetical protein